MKLLLTLLLILLLMIFSVSNIQQKSDFSEDNQHLLHAESSERLLKIMQQIAPIAGETGMEGTKTFTAEDITDLIEAVEELLFYAELMSIKIAATDLEENKSVVFNALASKLYSEALNIQQLAKNYDLYITDYSQRHIFNDAVTRLNQTCIACHQLFRD